LSHLIVDVTRLLYYYCTDTYYVLDLFHILWCQPVLDLQNINKFNSIQYTCEPVNYAEIKLCLIGIRNIKLEKSSRVQNTIFDEVIYACLVEHC
jgi:hypothetical protein